MLKVAKHFFPGEVSAMVRTLHRPNTTAFWQQTELTWKLGEI
jgi:hypothetical protein